MKKLSLCLILFQFIALCSCCNGSNLPGKFTIADGKYVRFSQGNLQYNASTDTWRFAEHQWDFVGDNDKGNVSERGVKCDNGQISDIYTGWIDLFGWGASGWDSGANAYQPWSTSDDYKDYYPGGDYNNDLTGEYANSDWGVFNRISNGGDKAGLWRMLTNDEWQYLLEHHSCGQATVNNVHGYVLLPEDWSAPSGILFRENPDSWKTNVYSAKQWSKMESAGAVFLPGAGVRNGLEVNDADWYGNYWSASHHLEYGARYIYFYEYYGYAEDWQYRSYGLSVRLVQDLN